MSMIGALIPGMTVMDSHSADRRASPQENQSCPTLVSEPLPSSGQPNGTQLCSEDSNKDCIYQAEQAGSSGSTTEPSSPVPTFEDGEVIDSYIVDEVEDKKGADLVSNAAEDDIETDKDDDKQPRIAVKRTQPEEPRKNYIDEDKNGAHLVSNVAEDDADTDKDVAGSQAEEPEFYTSCPEFDKVEDTKRAHLVSNAAENDAETDKDDDKTSSACTNVTGSQGEEKEFYTSCPEFDNHIVHQVEDTKGGDLASSAAKDDADTDKDDDKTSSACTDGTGSQAEESEFYTSCPEFDNHIVDEVEDKKGADLASNGEVNQKTLDDSRRVALTKAENVRLSKEKVHRWDSSDSGIEILEDISQIFFVDDALVCLQEAAELINIATNSLAKNASFHNAASNCLFDILKICDAWKLMLTRIKISSCTIVEKLHTACLKYIEGFPDQAIGDVHVIGDVLVGIGGGVKKTKTVLTNLLGNIKKAELALDEASLLAPVDSNTVVVTAQVGQCMEEYRLVRRNFKNALYLKLFANDCTYNFTWSADECYEIITRQSEEILRQNSPLFSDVNYFEIAQTSYRLALEKLSNLTTCLDTIGCMTSSWSDEYRSLADSDLPAKLNRTKLMNEEERIAFFEGTPIYAQLRQYLQRWRSLFKTCTDNLASMSPVRSRIDLLYTENPLPAEAVKRARNLAAQHKELIRELKLPERYEPIPRNCDVFKESDQIFALQLLFESVNKDAPCVEEESGDCPFTSDEYHRAERTVENLDRLLDILLGTVPAKFNRFIKRLHRNLRKLKMAALGNVQQYRDEAVRCLLQLYFSCLSWLHGLPEMATDDFHRGVLGIKGLESVVYYMCLTHGPEKMRGELDMLEVFVDESEGALVATIDEETRNYTPSEAQVGPTADDFGTHHLHVIEAHASAIENVKLMRISVEIYKEAIEVLPLNCLVRGHIRLGRQIEELFKEKQKLLVDVDPAEVYVPSEQHGKMKDSWMRSVHHLFQRINSFRRHCEKECSRIEDAFETGSREPLPSSGQKLSLEECTAMVERLGNDILKERIRESLTAVEGRVLGVEEADKKC